VVTLEQIVGAHSQFVGTFCAGDFCFRVSDDVVITNANTVYHVFLFKLLFFLSDFLF
jgi:hypothetical protein